MKYQQILCFVLLAFFSASVLALGNKEKPLKSRDVLSN
jgi:hypothetical protein